jgi:signal transduction histidine kinase
MLEMATLNEKQALEFTNKKLKNQQENLRNTMAVIVALAGFIIVGLMIGVIRTSQQAKAKLTAQNDTLIEQGQELQVQKEKLEQLNLTKNLLLSIVTHDVRGPVGGLKLTLELAKDRRLAEDDLRKLLNGLSDQVETTETLLNEVLLWAKTQMEGMEAGLAPLAIDRIMNDLVLQAGPQLQNKNVWTEEAGTASLVVANDGLLRVVLRNVLANAIRHTKPRQPILLTYVAQGTEAGISIQDHGHGMPDSAIQQLQGGQSTRQTISQHGLGLVLVQDFMHRMAGRIEVQASKEGTRFTLWLPAVAA